jgi:hypothetical protein
MTQYTGLGRNIARVYIVDFSVTQSEGWWLFTSVSEKPSAYTKARFITLKRGW